MLLCPEPDGAIAPSGLTTSAAAEEAVLVRIRGLSPEVFQGRP